MSQKYDLITLFSRIFWAFCIVTLMVGSAHAQKKRKDANMKLDLVQNKKYLITLKDESTFIGRYIEKTEETAIFESSASSRLELKISEIQSFSLLNDANIVDGKYWFPNPHSTRYLISPSAFNLKEGQGYYQNVYGTINSVNYGISDHFTIGAGTELITLFSGFPVLVLTPKLGGYNLGSDWRVGAGSIAAITSEGSAGIVYGISTYGNEDHNISFGLGWSFSNLNSFSSKPIATISGMTRFSRKTAFISENWLIPYNGYNPFFSYGLRFFGEYLSIDIALINSPDIFKFIPIGIPFVDFVYKF